MKLGVYSVRKLRVTGIKKTGNALIPPGVVPIFSMVNVILIAIQEKQRMGRTMFCSRLNDFKATAIVVIDYDAGTCSAKPICKAICGFRVVTKPRSEE